MTQMKLSNYEECHVISLHELETLQIKNELVNDRKSNNLLQIGEYCQKDSSIC